MNNFMENLKRTIGEEFNESVTENGAVGYRTSGKELLDLNFAVSSLRNETPERIKQRFAKAFFENKLLAIKWLFFAGDVRGGLGERRLFRIGMEYLAENEAETANKLLDLIPEYTRWDNLVVLLDTSLCDNIVAIIKEQLNNDMHQMERKNTISLCAKWMPSINASSMETRRLAKILISKLGVTERQYRKMLATLRAYTNVVEVKMSNREWSNIDYPTVPSRANLIYNNAFLRNDEQRRREYLGKLEKGETKINAGVLFPHDIVHKYMERVGWGVKIRSVDTALEEMWKALPNYVKESDSTICVADGSGSMTSTVGGTSISCLDIANALAIYFAERCSGQFRNKYITFSENPQLVDLSRGKTLRDKVGIALTHDECANTNIEAVFDLILRTAISTKMKQSDLPTNILILSDMEFDSCAVGSRSGWGMTKFNKKLFSVIAKRYADHGYKLPRLVFWNICSRTGTIPVKENELGVALVSGFSPSIVKMVLSNSIDPFECLLEQLNNERYAPLEQLLQGCL